MKILWKDSPINQLPISGELAPAFGISLVIAILMVAVSIGGLLFPSEIYSTDELLQSFVANDVVNLVIGLPTLLLSMWFTQRGKLTGLLLWPGALLYFVYNYIAYAVGLPISFITLAYILIVLLSAYTTFDLLKNIEKESVQKQLFGIVSEKIAGWVMVLFGVLFIFRALGIIVQVITNQTLLPISELGVLIADIVISILWIIGGTSLVRRMPLGYVSGLGLLFAASMLFIGLLMFLGLQPILANTPFVLEDLIAVIAMGAVCFVPFGLFLRGVVTGGNQLD